MQIIQAIILHIALVCSKAVVDQTAEASQASSVSVAQQRIGFDHSAPYDDHHHHEHHHEEHDPGFWKKKLVRLNNVKL